MTYFNCQGATTEQVSFSSFDFFSDFQNIPSITSPGILPASDIAPYSDMDLDISWNNVHGVYNNGCIGRPYFIMRKQDAVVVVDEKVVVGYCDMDWDYIDPSGGNPNSGPFSTSGTHYQVILDNKMTKFHKIKCNRGSPSNPGDWSTTGIHLCCQRDMSTTTPYSQNQLRYLRYNGPVSLSTGTPAAVADLVIAGDSASGDYNCGNFCSMDLSGENPRIAWYDPSYNNESVWLAWSDDGGQNWEPALSNPGLDCSGLMIDDNVGIWPETYNRNYISLACNQKDGSVHIAYFTDNSGIKYWTNSSIESTPHPIPTDSSNTKLDVIAYGKLPDDPLFSTNPTATYTGGYIDLSWNVVNGYDSVYCIDTPPPHITVLAKVENSKSFDATLFDQICVKTRVITASNCQAAGYQDIFLLGSTTTCGGYFSGTQSGCLFFGIQCNSVSSPPIRTTRMDSGLPSSAVCIDLVGGNSGNQIVNDVRLEDSTEYEIEIYYDKNDRWMVGQNTGTIDLSQGIGPWYSPANNGGYATVSVTKIDAPIVTDPSSNLCNPRKYIWYDISGNTTPGTQFNMEDGYLTIGAGGHDGTQEPWFGTIKRIAIYNTDISTVPIYDISSSTGPGIPFAIIKSDYGYNRFADYSGNERGGTYPVQNQPYQYQIYTDNSYNTIQGISGSLSSISSKKQIHDYYYLQRTPTQPSYVPGLGVGEIRALDTLGDTMLAVGSTQTATDKSGYILISTDGGFSWIENTHHPTYGLNYFYYFCVKLYKDPAGTTWAFVGGINYGLFFTTDNVPGKLLGAAGTWGVLGAPYSFFSCGTGLGGVYNEPTNWYSTNALNSAKEKRRLTYVYPVDLSKNLSNDLFGSDPSDNDFHLWIGTGYNYNNDSERKGPPDMVFRGNYDSFTKLSTTITATPDISWNPTDASGNPNVKMNQIWNDVVDGSGNWSTWIGLNGGIAFGTPANVTDPSGGLAYGVICGSNYIHVTNDGGASWGKRLKQRVAMDNLGAYAERNKVLAVPGDPSNVQDLSSFTLLLNRVPWTGVDGYDYANGPHLLPVITNNRGVFDLSFGPHDLSFSVPKTQWWDPSLNDNSYWDPANPPFVDRAVANYNSGQTGNRYVVDICTNITDGSGTYLDNHWVLGETDTNFASSNPSDATQMLFHKATLQQPGGGSDPPVYYSTNTWERIDFEANATPNFRGHVSVQTSLRDGGVVLGVQSDETDLGGVYALTAVPPIPNIIVTYPYLNNNFKAEIASSSLSNIDVIGNIYYTVYLSKDANEPRTFIYADAFFYPDSGGGGSTVITLDSAITYTFYLIASNFKGDSWRSNEITIGPTPTPAPTIDSVVVTGTYLQNKLTWENPVDVFFYDISRSWIPLDPSSSDVSGSSVLWGPGGGNDPSGLPNPDAPHRTSFIDYDVSLNRAYTYFLTGKDNTLAVESPTYESYTSIRSGIPFNTALEYIPSDNELKLTWDDQQFITDPSTSVIYGISMEKIGGATNNYTSLYKYFTVPNTDLSKNFTYQFGFDASYNNQTVVVKSPWTDPSNVISFTLDAPVPTNFDASYNYINDIVTFSWTPTTFYGYEPIKYDISYNGKVQPPFDDVTNTTETMSGQDLSGGQTIPSQVRAVYPKFDSSYCDVSNIIVPAHTPLNFIVKAYNRQGQQCVTDASMIQISWDATTGISDSSGYTLTRYDTYSGDKNNFYVGSTVVGATETILPPNTTYNDYDLVEPTTGTSTVPRRYKYSLKANYP